jgi:tricarballylate dehydrogenase
MSSCNVIVVGAGNAGLCAALAAHEQGASVMILECAPEVERGGNSRFTAGAIRVAYEGVEDLRALMPDLSDEEVINTDFGQYTEEQFFDDMARVTEYRANPDLVELLVGRSMETLQWMKTKGVRFTPIYGRQAFKVDGRFKFWGGLTVEAWGGGPGLVDALFSTVEKSGIKIHYQTRALDLIRDGNKVCGVMVSQGAERWDLSADAVVLASGGFEANAEWRTRYLGPGWDLAKVRGSRFNVGDGIRMALDNGAMPYGNWSGCHSVGWERNAPEFGDLAVGDGFQKHSYPFAIMLNANGERFVDEGADFRNYTYAKYGGEILKQPGQFAWQIFDSKVEHLLRDEYRIRQVTKVTSGSIETLVEKLDGVTSLEALRTISEYNDSIAEEIKFDPNIKDGKCTQGLAIPKSNWANRIDTPPFSAYAVTCGITFTFGGLKINQEAQVMDTSGDKIANLFAAGELVGGLFYFNYPGGSGLTSGAVFGRIAGTSAGKIASLER